MKELVIIGKEGVNKGVKYLFFDPFQTLKNKGVFTNQTLTTPPHPVVRGGGQRPVCVCILFNLGEVWVWFGKERGKGNLGKGRG